MKTTNKTRLALVPESQWPTSANDETRKRVYRSRKFLVQEFLKNGITRLSVNRVAHRNGGWKEGIAWDELQAIKSEVGYGEMTAVEVYPPNSEVVNVANMRHLWLCSEPIAGIGWYKQL